MRKLDSLTTLRFFAAAMIVLHHSMGRFGIPGDAEGRVNLGQAVAFFFVLSGFILTYVYPSLDTWEARGRFWLARIARIWPAHLAAFALLWLLLESPDRFPTGNSYPWLAAVNILMVQAWVPIRNVFFSYNSVSWSISTEVAFYLLFPLLIWRWERTWWFKLPIVFMLGLAAVFLCGYANLPNDSPDAPWAISRTGVLYINPIARLLEFTVGMTTALVFRKVSEKIRLSIVLATIMELLAIGLVVANMYYTPEIVALFRNLPVIGEAFEAWIVQGPVCCLAFAVLIFAAGLQRGAIARALSHKLGILLGEISFTIYLLHFILLYFYDWKWRAFDSYPHWLCYLYFWAILMVLAWVVWAGFERPMRARILALWPNRDPKSIAKQLARAYETPMRGSHWSPLLAPNAKAWFAGVIGLLLLLTPAALATRETARPAEVAAIVAATPSDIRGARFGDKLELLGERFSPGTRTMEPRLELVCHALRVVSGEVFIGIHFVDSKGNILAQADVLEDAKRFSAADPWIEKVPIPREKCADATAIALAVYQSGSPPDTVDRGPRDWDNHRLLISVAPPSVPATSKNEKTHPIHQSQ